MYSNEPWTLFRNKSSKMRVPEETLEKSSLNIRYLKTANDAAKIFKANYKSLRKILDNYEEQGLLIVSEKKVNNRPFKAYYLTPEKSKMIKEQIKKLKESNTPVKCTEILEPSKPFHFYFETKYYKVIFEVQKKTKR